mgnify:FL=1
MFQIGDKVVYPVHGAGVIEAIEKRVVLGEEKHYYVLAIPTSSMKVLVPLDNANAMGIRYVIKEDEVASVIEVLKGPESPMVEKWNYRYRLNMDKLKSGDIYEVAEVVRNLSLRDIVKTLSSGEKRLLDQAKDILVSELVLVGNENADGVMEKLELIFKGVEDAPDAQA